MTCIPLVKSTLILLNLLMCACYRRPLQTTDRPASETRFSQKVTLIKSGSVHPKSTDEGASLSILSSEDVHEGQRRAKPTGSLTVTFSEDGRIVVSKVETKQASSSASVQPESHVSERHSRSRSTSVLPKSVAVVTRSALYDGELSANREAEGYGTLTFSNGDVYRGKHLE
jgi:hypothetical protein